MTTEEAMQIAQTMMQQQGQPAPRQALTEEQKKERLERAIKLSEMFKSEAGQMLMEQLTKMEAGCNKSPETFLRRDASGRYSVDEILLATWVGYRNALLDIMRFAKVCDTLITEEAKRASSAQSASSQAAS